MTLIHKIYNNYLLKRINEDFGNKRYIRKVYGKHMLISELPWYYPIYTSLYHIDNRTILLFFFLFSAFVFYPDSAGALQSCVQAIIVACTFDFFFNVLTNQRRKAQVAERVYTYVRRIKERTNTINIILEHPQDLAVDDNNIENTLLNFDINKLDERLSTRVSVKKDEDLYDFKKNAIAKKEYLVLSLKNNLEDIESLLSLPDIHLFSKTHRALIAAESSCKWHLNGNNSCNCMRVADDKQKISNIISYHIYPFQRLIFWTIYDMASFNPDVRGLRSKFTKNSPDLYKIWGQRIIGYKIVHGDNDNNENKMKSRFSINSFMKWFLFILSVFLIIKQSEIRVVEWIPETLSMLFMKSDSWSFLYPFSASYIVVVLYNLIFKRNKSA